MNFKFHKKEIVIYAPCNGKLVALKDVPDPVFSQEMMGKGMAIIPEDGEMKAPLDGTLLVIPETKHAFGIEQGKLDVLVHIGIDTVVLKGEGFTTAKTVGGEVKRGETIIQTDLEVIVSKAKSTIVPIVLTNMEEVDSVKYQSLGKITTDDWIMKVVLK